MELIAIQNSGERSGLKNHTEYLQGEEDPWHNPDKCQHLRDNYKKRSLDNHCDREAIKGGGTFCGWYHRALEGSDEENPMLMRRK